MDGSETSTRQRRSARGIGGSLGNAGVVGTTTVGTTVGTTIQLGQQILFFGFAEEIRQDFFLFFIWDKLSSWFEFDGYARSRMNCGNN